MDRVKEIERGERLSSLNALNAQEGATSPEGWNEAAARRQIEEAWLWADRVTPSGCWASLPDEVCNTLQMGLDAAFDRINQAFADQDAVGLNDGLQRFRRTVLAAVKEQDSISSTSLCSGSSA